MALDHADTARLAHRALRLRENGVDSERAVRELAAVTTTTPDEDPVVGRGGHPLSQIAFAVESMTSDDLPGPTEPAVVAAFMTRGDLMSIWQMWDEAVTANLEATLDDDALREWRTSVDRDEHAFRERVAEMQETGDWPVHPAFGHARHLAGAANALYDEGRAGFLSAEIDWDTAVIKAVLVDSADYTVNLATHKFLSSVAAGGREETSAALTTKTVAAGVADADDTSWPSAAGDPCEAVILVQSSAVGGGGDVADTAQRLIGYIDTATGLPVTLNGGTINMVWDSGANRIFKL